MKLSIVTGTVNRSWALKRLVSSIFEHAQKNLEWELIIADASETPTIIKHDRIRILHEWPRIGHAAGYNKAFKQAKGEYVCWLNDDVVVKPSWDLHAIRFMEENPWCGLGAIYYSEQGCCYHINHYPYPEMPYANFGIIKRILGEQIGWFDEFCRMYGADNSIAFKTILAGYGVAGCIGSKVDHLSVMDDIKRENVRGQPEDAKHLMMHYQPLVDEMRAACRNFPVSPRVLH